MHCITSASVKLTLIYPKQESLPKYVPNQVTKVWIWRASNSLAKLNSMKQFVSRYTANVEDLHWYFCVDGNITCLCYDGCLARVVSQEVGDIWNIKIIFHAKLLIEHLKYPAKWLIYLLHALFSAVQWCLPDGAHNKFTFINLLSYYRQKHGKHDIRWVVPARS